MSGDKDQYDVYDRERPISEKRFFYLLGNNDSIDMIIRNLKNRKSAEEMFKEATIYSGEFFFMTCLYATAMNILIRAIEKVFS